MQKLIIATFLGWLITLPVKAQVETSSPKIITEITLEQINFEGNTVISDAELTQAIADYLNRTYSLQEIGITLQEISAQIREFYWLKGYQFVRVSVAPEQDLTQPLTVIISEGGRITDIEVTGLERMPSWYVENRINALVKPPVNLQDIELAFSTLEEDPRFQLVTGNLGGNEDGSGELTLDVNVVEGDAFGLQIEGNNYNNYLIGENQLDFRLSSNNLLGIADTATFGWQHTEGSDQFGIGYGLPVNGKGGEINAYYSQGNSIIVISPFNDFDIEQFQQTVGVRYTQPVVWKSRHKLSLYFGVNWTQTNSSLLGEDFSFTPDIQDASTRYTAISLGQTWTYRGNNQVFAIDTEFSFGADWFDATVIDTPSGIDALFKVVRLQALYAHQISPDLLFRWNFWGQLTPDALLIPEKIFVGGFVPLTGVPGSPYNFISGDNGFSTQMAFEYPIWKADNCQNLTFIPAVTAAHVDNNKFPSPIPDTLASVSVGLRYECKGFTIRGDYARPFNTKNVRQQNIGVSVRYQFRF